MLNSKKPTTSSKIISLEEYKKKRVDHLKKQFRQKAINAAIKHAEEYFPKEES